MKHSSIAVFFLLGLFFFAGMTNVHAAKIFGVTTTNQLVSFDSLTPGTVTTVGAITGLQANENILGIDERPATTELYGLGSTSRIYKINKTTGAATVVGGQLTPALNGTNFGFDFNPTVDRIRIVSDTGQNLRANPDTGTVIIDGTLNPATPKISAAAYFNNLAGATSTLLYVIDPIAGMLYQQNPANDGTLQAVGSLGLTAAGAAGFDILSDKTAFAALTVGGVSGVYQIDLTSGRATLISRVGGGVILRGIAGDFAQAPVNTAPTLLDFNGDKRADYSVFRQSNGFWYTNFSSSASNTAFTGTQFGDAATDILTPGDYDGDGKTDIAVWRRTNGVFYVLRSSDNTVLTRQFGQIGDEPVARDYDGDRKTDFAVVRGMNDGTLVWYILNSGSNNSFRAEQFGSASDIVAPGDYDGDGKFDLAVFRGTGDGPATFFVKQSAGGFLTRQFGLASDLVVPGDYDGDGKTDFAVLRAGSSYEWYILRSSNNSLYSVQLGASPDFSTQADYDGDGKTDVSVYRMQTGTFYVIRSSDNGVTQRQFGQNGDYPVANYDTH